MNSTLKTHRYLGQTIETMLEIEKEEEHTGEVYFWAEVSIRINGNEPVVVAGKRFESVIQAMDWALENYMDEDFERIN